METYGRLIDDRKVPYIRQKDVLLELSNLKIRYFNQYDGLVDYISRKYQNTVEIGIGHFPDVAFALLRKGVNVFATDIKPFYYNSLEVIIDDITVPDFYLYLSVDLIYSLRPPPELIPYMVRVAKMVSADVIVKPLRSDYVGGNMIRNGSTTLFLLDCDEKDEKKEKRYF